MKKTTNLLNLIQVICFAVCLISLLMYFATQNYTHYATINGESFSIPKIEGEGYYEKDTNCVR